MDNINYLNTKNDINIKAMNGDISPAQALNLHHKNILNNSNTIPANSRYNASNTKTLNINVVSNIK